MSKSGTDDALITRRALLSLAVLAPATAVPAAKVAPTPATEKPATVTVRCPIPECICGYQMVVVPWDWERRRDARRIVCINGRCEQRGIVAVQTLYEAVVDPRRMIPHGTPDEQAA